MQFSEHWQELLSKYLEDAQKPQSESARAHAFSILLPQLFAHQPELIAGYSDGIETFLKEKRKGGTLRGRADNVFGHLIIEFEGAIPKKRAEAEEQIRRYAAIQWTHEAPHARTPFLGIATDGVRFLTFAPICDAPEKTDLTVADVHLEMLEEFDWTKHDATEIYFWLDRTLLRQEILTPTGERVVADFGARSHAFKHARAQLLGLWHRVLDEPSFAVVRESWEKYLLIVYGAKVAEDDLWIRHTYLATLAKLMSWQRLTPDKAAPDNNEIVEMLEGELFKKRGISNFIEQDFFSWLARPEAQSVAIELVRGLASLLRSYNLALLSEDVLKSLYQGLVDPSERHDLGEYYTPDWLAHQLVNQMLDEKTDGAMLDPTCGSGTFLYLAIREKIARMGASKETCAHILDSVCGADIHPLAVIISKTNYILALGDLLTKHRPSGTIRIPIYLADTLRLPAKFMEGDFSVDIEKRKFFIDESLVNDADRGDAAIELQNDFASQHKNKPMKRDEFAGFIRSRGFVADDDLTDSMFAGAQTLKHFMDIDRDSIWAYVIKNIYKPLFFRHKFDFVMGNPPWIALRFMEPDYQSFLKQKNSEYSLSKGRAHLVTQMEVAALFLVRAADLYLKSGGTIGFVLPRSFFSADQHDGLRRRSFRLTESGHTLRWRELWDCERVKPLFSVPTCVIIGQKIPLDQSTPQTPAIDGQSWSGRLSRKNASLEEARASLDIEYSIFQTHTHDKRSYWASGDVQAARNASFYKKHFDNGATIYPRSFWFVQPQSSPFGFDATRPPLQSAARAVSEAKPAYKTVSLEGQVESRFLYATLIATDMLPFGHLPFRLVALPIAPEGEGYKMLNATQARTLGAFDLAQWIDRVEAEWQTRRSSKAENMTAIQWLNYSSKITKQKSQTKYRVLYNKSGTYLTANVVENLPFTFDFGGQEIQSQGFISDNTTYCLETDSLKEAHYVSAVLNAPIIDELTKPMQTRGLFGPRDIAKKVLELPIPQYSASDARHVALSSLGALCDDKVRTQIACDTTLATASIGRARGFIRVFLRDELAQIDELVKAILE